MPVEVIASLLSESEKLAIGDAKRKIQELFEQAEQKNVEMLYAKEYGTHSTIGLRLRPPSQDQVSPAYDVINSTLAKFQPGTPAEIEMRRQAELLLAKYTSFQKRFRILHLVSHADTEKPRQLFEFDANDEATAQSSQIDGRGLHLDENYDGKDSWARARYSHLFPN